MKKGMIDTLYEHAMESYEKRHGMKAETEEQVKDALREMFHACVPELANI